MTPGPELGAEVENDQRLHTPEEIAPGITVDQAVRFGKPVLKGTRVPVDLVVGKLAGGMSIAEIAEEYELQPGAVLAALAYASQILAAEEVWAIA